MIKLIESLFRRSSDNLIATPPASGIQTTFLTVDQAGNRWYAFADPLDMNIVRQLQMDDAQDYLAMNLTRDRLQALLDRCIEHANANELVELFALLQEMRLRLELLGNREAYLHICAVYYLLEGEDPATFDDQWYGRKKALLTQDVALQDFFLRHWLTTFKAFTPALAQDMVDYLKKVARLTSHFDRHFSPPSTNAARPSTATTS
jgi:hypothetical protein